MLEWLLYWFVDLSIGSSRYSAFTRNSWLIFIIKLGTMFTKNLLKTLAIPLPLLTILPFSYRVMHFADFTLSKKWFCGSPKFLLISNVFRIQIYLATSYSQLYYLFSRIYFFVLFHSSFMSFSLQKLIS